MLQLLTDIPNSQARQRELLHRLDRLPRPQRVQMLCLAIDDPYPPIRHDVAEALQQELDPELTRFLEFLSLGELPPEELLQTHEVPPEFFPQHSERARVAACVALEASPTPEETAQVIQRLIKDDSSDMRYQALIALHHLAPGSDPLRQSVEEALLHDQDSEIVVVASQIAISNHWDDILPLLVEARTRLRGEDRQQLTFSIGELIGETSASAAALEPSVRQELLQECVNALRNERLTAAAARTLANLEAREATADLQRVMDGWFVHPILKVDAAVALLKLGNPTGEDYIGRALSLRRKDARGYALRVIGEHRLQRFFPHLVEVALSDTYHADTAALALLDFGTPEALAALEKIAESHPDPDVQEIVREGLQKKSTLSFPDPPGVDGSILPAEKTSQNRRRN